MTAELTQAASYATQAAADCGVQDYTTASREISLMTSSITAATSRIEDLTGQ